MRKRNFILNTLIIVLIISSGIVTYYFLMNRAESISIINTELKSELDKLKNNQSTLQAEKLKLDNTHSAIEQKLKKIGK
jgi:hypothetical protein